MSSIYCQHGEFTHPWDCFICEDLANIACGDIINDRAGVPEERIPTLEEVLGWQ